MVHNGVLKLREIGFLSMGNMKLEVPHDFLHLRSTVVGLRAIIIRSRRQIVIKGRH